MYTFICKRSANSVPNWFTCLRIRRCNSSIFVSKSLTSLVTEDDKLPDNSTLVSYLVNSCGLSRKRAEDISLKYGHKLKINLQKADSVLEFLRNHGFTTTDFSTIFNSQPRLLCVNLEKTLLPKVQFFYSIGFSKEDFPRFFCGAPSIMKRSLQKHIIPLHGFIRSVLGDDEKTAMALKRGGWFIENPVHLIPNISLLRENGVPPSKIEYLLFNYTRDLLMKHSNFCKVLKEVMEFGYNPRKSVFLLAIHTMGNGYKSTRERCIKVYKEYKWSEENIRQAFLKHPACLILSEKKLRSILEFLIKKVGYQAEEIASRSPIFGFSLERRIIPRYSVIRALSLMGLTDKKFTLNSVLSPPDSYFIYRFIHKYDKAAPQLLNVYQGKLDPFESNSAHFCRSSK